jgi:hypothetical protein
MRNDNYLIDLDKKIIPKLKDGDFLYSKDKQQIIIKNFDVQNPLLRLYGTRYLYPSKMSEDETTIANTESFNKIKDKVIENDNKFIYNQNLCPLIQSKTGFRRVTHYKTCKLEKSSNKNNLIDKKNKYPRDSIVNRTFKILTRSQSLKSINNKNKISLTKKKKNNIFFQKALSPQNNGKIIIYRKMSQTNNLKRNSSSNTYKNLTYKNNKNIELSRNDMNPINKSFNYTMNKITSKLKKIEINIKNSLLTLIKKNNKIITKDIIQAIKKNQKEEKQNIEFYILKHRL